MALRCKRLIFIRGFEIVAMKKQTNGNIYPIPRESKPGESKVSAERILGNLNTAVITLDADLLLTSINSAAEVLFALSANQILGQPVITWLSGDHSLESILRQVLENQHPLTAREVSLSLPSGKQVTVDYTITPNTSHQKNEIALTLELVRVDRMLRLVNEEKMLHMHTTNRALIRGVAHEIKNPLGGIRGAAQLLEKELTEASLGEYTQIIIQEVDRLRNLIDRMLGPIQPANRVALNVHEVLEHIKRLVLAEVPDGLSIRTDYDPSLPELVGERDQLIQAILNIVRNAVEAMGAKGKIQIRTRVERQHTIAQRRHRLVIRIDIEDSGPGIPAEILGDIFYPLVTSRAEGTGLGLAIAQDIVSRHGGLIQCRSKPGETVFSIFLPLESNHDSV